MGGLEAAVVFFSAAAPAEVCRLWVALGPEPVLEAEGGVEGSGAAAGPADAATGTGAGGVAASALASAGAGVAAAANVVAG